MVEQAIVYYGSLPTDAMIVRSNIGIYTRWTATFFPHNEDFAIISEFLVRNGPMQRKTRLIDCDLDIEAEVLIWNAARRGTVL
jgi:hypothetical protein